MQKQAREGDTVAALKQQRTKIQQAANNEMRRIKQDADGKIKRIDAVLAKAKTAETDMQEVLSDIG